MSIEVAGQHRSAAVRMADEQREVMTCLIIRTFFFSISLLINQSVFLTRPFSGVVFNASLLEIL